VPPNFSRQFLRSLRSWWRDQSDSRASEEKAPVRTSLLLQKFWEFSRDSLPDRRRQRYGDMEYDWENRVDTTSGTVGWRERLLGLFHSPYQPTDPVLFHEIMTSLPIQFENFTFVDLGSGKGRTLLMASDYPFRRIVGVELIEELHRVAEQNIAKYRNPAQRCRQIKSVCADTREYDFPHEPLVVYLFNPLPEPALLEVLERLEKSMAETPRPIWIAYHNPELERVLSRNSKWAMVSSTERYCVYRSGR
jgi:SAM-dependent methyltransferase